MRFTCLLTRRTLLRGAVVGAAGGLLATSSAGLTLASPLIAATPAAAAAPSGELRMAVASFPNRMDALIETTVLRFGVGETLMRLTPTYDLVPWLAEGVVNSDPLTWRVRLRALQGQALKEWTEKHARERTGQAVGSR